MSKLLPSRIVALLTVARYCNMDYVVLSALLGVALLHIIITYDIACQWFKNFTKRMSGFPEHMRIGGDVKIDTAIPSWHINGHGPSCRQNFCLGFMKGVGRTCGEEIEVSWSHTNPLATSVREMGPAARHETLNDHWNGWNFHKIVGFRKRLYYLLCRTSTDPLAGKSFLRKLREAAKMQVRHEDIFKQLSATFSATLVKKWTAMVERWEHDHSTQNPYEEPESGKIQLLQSLVRRSTEQAFTRDYATRRAT